MRYGPEARARLDRAVQDNLRRVALVAGLTFAAFAVLHLTPAGSRLPSQVLGNVVGAAGLLGLLAYLRHRREPLRRPNAALAGAFAWVLAVDAFLTWTDASAVSLNVALFVMLLAGALMFSLPALLVVLAAAAAEGLFVATLVPGGHLASQLALEAAAGALAVVIHSTRLSTHRRLDQMLTDKEAHRAQLAASVEEARAGEERFRRLADAAFEGLAIHDQGRFVDCNDAFEKMFGYGPGELLGKSAFDIIDEAHHPLIQARIASPIDEAYEALGRRKDGSTLPVEIAGKPIPYRGRMLRVVALRDVTERRAAEAAAQEQVVARRIVRRALHGGARADPSLLTERRRLGRLVASETKARTLEEGLEAFRSLGLGHLAFVSSDGGRWTFTGRDLLDRDPGARMPSCTLALGFVEGLLGHLTARDMLGAELSCESQGHAECRFIALAKGAAPQDAERGAGASVSSGSVGSRSTPSPTLTRPGSVRPPSGPP